MPAPEISRQDAKIDLWERKLLDLTTRNALLNVKIKGNTIPLFVTSSCDIEDSISSEKDYVIISRNDNELIPAGEYGIEDLANTESFIEELNKATEAGNIYSALSAKDLEDKLKALYRNSRAAIEEDGAGTLFLACGLLKWIDDKKDNTAYYAPIVLVPVELVRKFGVGKYVLRKTDEDAIMNRSLVEKLKRDFDIDISELDGEIEDDESGKNVRGVLDTLTNTISTKDGWSVIDACVLGMFSFSKFVMWNDLRLHREELAKNDIVRSLLDGHLSWTYEDMEKSADEFKGDDNILLPITADNSQLYAIKSACGDSRQNTEPKSFVLHGPPGTGKSQTITSMIANAIADGKTVLFAAEKKAALDVVYSRLSRIGLEPFCLELHSNKIRKGWVLDQLKEALEYKLKNMPESGYDKALKEIQARRDELDIYNEELTRTQECGFSLYEMLCIYAENQDAPDITLEDGYDEGLTEDRISASAALLGEYIAVGDGLSGVLPYVGATEYSQDTKVKLPSELQAWEASVKHLEMALSALTSTMTLSSIGTGLPSCGKASAMITNYLAARTKILSSWKIEFLAQDAAALKNAYTAASGKIAPFRGMAVNKVYNNVKQYEKTPGANKSGLGELLDEFASYKDTFTRLGFAPAAAVSPALPEFNAAYKEYGAARAAAAGRLGISRTSADFAEELSLIADIRSNEAHIREKTIANKAAANGDALKIRSVISAYEEGILNKDNITPAYMKAWSKLMICKVIDGSEILSGFSGKVFDERVSKLKALSDEFRDITKQEIIIRIARRLPSFNEDANSASGLGFLQRAIKSRGRGVSIRALFREAQELILKLTPCVLMSPISAAQFIAPSDTPMFDLVIFDEASQLPTCEAVGAIARGKHAVIVGDPMQMPPTSFFRDQTAEEENADTDDLESILDDCLAAGMPQTRLLWHYRSRHESLITFSNRSFYDSKLYTFPSVDDRASRVTLVRCDGIFDSGRTRTNEAEAKAVTAELVARSKDPELSKLTYGIVTFNIQQQNLIEDMVDDACRQDPEFEKWAYGGEEPVFIKNLENVQGDERDVILFSVNYGPDSEGNVSMNFGPINKDGGWRRLNVAVTRSRCEMKVFSSLPPERIRTSEATPEGVLAFKRFLLYAEGNEMWDSDLAAAADNNGTSFIDRSARVKGVKEDICRRLREKGYFTATDIGKSCFKVDVGVMESQDADKYCLGILIDGSSANTNSSSSNREIEQPSMLKGLGWNVIRVWSIEWWENPDRVIEECIEAIKNGSMPDPEPASAENASESEESAPDSAPVAENSAEIEKSAQESAPETQKKTEFAVPYVKADVTLPEFTSKQFCDAQNLAVLESAAKTVIETEAPISFDLYMRRLTDACGIKRKTPQVRERCLYLLRRLKYPVSEYRDPDYDRLIIWKNEADRYNIMPYYRVPESPEDMRDQLDMPIEEAARAAIYLARSQYGMPYEDLVYETGKALGFKTSTPNVKLMTSLAIDFAVKKGELTRGERLVK